MKQNTNNLPNFQIVIDGELQVPSIAERTVSLLGHVGAITSTLASKMGNNVATEVLKPVELDLFDAVHGTELRHEYFEKKRELAVTAMREEVGL